MRRPEKKERIGRFLQMHANKRQEIAEVYAGDIVAAIGLKGVVTGQTLCAPKSPVVFEALVFPDPVISIAIEPKTTADMDKLGQSLDRLAIEDPTFYGFDRRRNGPADYFGHGRASS